MAAEIRSHPSIKEPGAERRQAMIAAIREISAESIEKIAYICISCQLFDTTCVVAHKAIEWICRSKFKPEV
jgi:hypothetical protein